MELIYYCYLMNRNLNVEPDLLTSSITTLVLNNSDMIVGTDNHLYRCDDIRSSFTFKGVDLQRIIGAGYDVYDKFNLCLTSVMFNSNDSELLKTVTATDININAYISGLNWCEGAYDVNYREITNKQYLAPFVLAKRRDLSYIIDNNILQFNRPSGSFTDITIDFVTIKGNKPDLEYAIYECVLCFKIIGVK